jgi:hypothetical protein
MELRHICARPEAPNGYTFVTASVSAGGEGLFLFVGDDPEGSVHAREERGVGIFPKPRMPQAKPFKLSVIGLTGSYSCDVPPLDLAFPHVELFPDGRILLAGARSSWRGPQDFDVNAAVFDPRTGALHRILLGDGIEDIAIDGSGRIWVSYFDEGVFGNFGWSNPGPPGLGAGGLVCFDAAGNVLWRFNREDSESVIDDCYAMNASREAIWVFYYSDFRVCRVGMDFSTHYFRPDNVAGSHALAVSDSAFLFSNQYDERGDTMHLVLRDGDRLRRPRKVVAEPPNGWPLGEAKIVGRGESLNFLNDMGWFKADLGDLVSRDGRDHD